MKYKIGDEVRITKKISSHNFNIGDIVKNVKFVELEED